MGIVDNLSFSNNLCIFLRTPDPALPNNNSWRFILKDYVFRNPTNPFASDFPEILVIPNLADVLGKVLMTSEKTFAKGLNEVVFDAALTPSVSSSVFVVRLQTATGVAEQKIVLQR
jgi:hypothetical protein